MFYSQMVLCKKGPLAKLWLAAHNDKKLSRPQIFAFDICQAARDIANPVVPLSLYVSGHLLLGLVNIHSRKVKYLMEDVIQFSNRINSASSGAPTSAIDLSNHPLQSKRGRGEVDAGDHLPGFGEFHPFNVMDAMGGFELPTNLVPEDWDTADSDDENEDHVNSNNYEDLILPARKRFRTFDDSVDNIQNTDVSTLLQKTGVSTLTTSWEAEEEWPPFDDEEDENGKEGNEDGKSIPEVEKSRSSNNLNDPYPQLGDGRPSMFLKDDEEMEDDVNVNNMEDDTNMMPFDVDDTGDTPAMRSTDLNSNDSHDKSVSRHSSSELSIDLQSSKSGVEVGGLETSTDDDDMIDREDQPAIKSTDNEMGGVGVPRRKRPIRRIVIDNDDVCLSDDVIRRNMNDDREITLVPMRPDFWIPGLSAEEQPKMLQRKSESDIIYESNTLEELLMRPALADNGRLRPALLKFYARNTSTIIGIPFNYPLLVDSSPKTRVEDSENIRSGERDEEKDESVEDMVKGNAADVSPFPEADDGFPNEDTPPERFGEDDDVAPLMDDGIGGVFHEQSNYYPSFLNNENDDGEEDGEGNARQNQGEQLASSSSKWHKHTIKVYDILHRNMPIDEPRIMSLDHICDPAVVNRRDACGVFSELLQFQASGVIDLNQDGHFTEVKISPGVKFNEKPPTSF